MGATGLLLVAAAVLAWFLVLRPPAVPSQADGEAWLAGFVDRLVDARTLGAVGPGALALFPGLGPWSAGDCVTSWSRTDPSAPVVTYQRLELGRAGADACDKAQFGMLSTTLRQSEGITPGALAERLTGQFGQPDIHRDAGLRGSVTYQWQILDGVWVHMSEAVQPGGADDFSVLFVRSYASPSALPTVSEGLAWMDGTVALLTGPELPRARGAAAAGMVGAAMQGYPDGASDCQTDFMADLLKQQPIASGQTLSLEQDEGRPCSQARFSRLSMRVWQRAPVTAEALVTRISAKVGSPAVTRVFDQDGITYQWQTAHGTTVELFEGLTGDWQHWLALRAWMSGKDAADSVGR